jgi:hypothetical protein
MLWGSELLADPSRLISAVCCVSLSLSGRSCWQRSRTGSWSNVRALFKDEEPVRGNSAFTRSKGACLAQGGALSGVALEQIGV